MTKIKMLEDLLIHSLTIFWLNSTVQMEPANQPLHYTSRALPAQKCSRNTGDARELTIQAHVLDYSRGESPCLMQTDSAS